MNLLDSEKSFIHITNSSGPKMEPCAVDSSRSISAGLPISYCLHVKSRFSQRPPGVASHPGSL